MTGESEALHRRVRFEQRSAASRKAWRTRKRMKAAQAATVAPSRETSFPSVGGGYPKLCPHGNLEQFPGDCDLCVAADSTQPVLTIEK